LAYGELLYALEELAEMSNAVVKWARDRGIQKRSGEASIAISEDAKGRELVSRLRLLNDQIKRQGRTVSILSSDGVHDALYRVLYAMHERMGWMLDTMQEALDGEVNLPELEVDELGAKFNDAVGEFYVAVRKELRVK
jgi:hypothetical protein